MQTNNVQRPRNPWFEIAKTADGYEWCLWTGNGRPICTSAVAYNNANDAKQSIRTLLKAVSDVNALSIRVASDFLPAKKAAGPSPTTL